MDSKFYAATQVMDEARHVEMYGQYVRDKIELAYPINEHLKALLNDVIEDKRWDMTYLGMQVVIEGLALAAFSLIRDFSEEPLAKAINTYVMQDEARHVAFGRLALKDFYPELTQAERDEREEFVVEACYLMRDRFQAKEVWERLGFDVKRCLDFTEQSDMMKEFRKMLFTRIVPTVKDIGLWGPKIRKAYEDMGVIQFQDMDPDSLSEQDEALARKLDTSHGLTQEQEASAKLAGVDPQRALEVQETIRLGAEE
jgi:1,2-phenylacetyl-CoA epoxidase catalytic subunit